MSWITLRSGTGFSWRGFLKAGVAAGFLLLVGSSCFAGNQPKSQLAPEAAQALVEEYRELRRSCASMAGEQRKLCFSQLHAHNGEYRLAKQQLMQDENDNSKSVHLVTF